MSEQLSTSIETVGELVRKAENDYLRGTTQISKYVSHNMYETINTVEAYLNSKHISGETDSLGRDKPFFNIVLSRANIWQRATDIDRSWIKIRASKTKDMIASFVATQLIQQWMREENFGAFLNEWGRVSARYNSAIVKFVENSSGLHISVVPWNRIIVDAVDFDANPKIEILELTEAQLRAKPYNQDQIEALIGAAKKQRETTDRQRKDNKSGYYKLYEVHGNFSQAFYKQAKGKKVVPADYKIFFDQIHVLSTVGTKKKADNKDFILYSGKEDDPYMITHLNPEDGRTLAIGPGEALFIAQWMTNHTAKNEKDALDIAAIIAFQTSDPNYLNRNIHTSFDSGGIYVHAPNQPLTQMNTAKPDVVSAQNNRAQWIALGNEITGISEAMLGVAAKSGTAWRQTQALLEESHSLFEQFTETKGLYLARMFRERIISHIKKRKMNNAKEIAATLEAHDIDFVDSMYIPEEAVRRYNERFIADVLAEREPQPFNKEQEELNVEQDLEKLRNQRFFKPSDIKDTTWKKALENLEWNLEVDVTGEAKNVQNEMATLDTALRMMLTPGFAENKAAQAVVGKILNLAGGMSPLEYGSIIKKGVPSNALSAEVPQVAVPQ